MADRCTGLTKVGNQCKRRVCLGSQTCSFHNGNQCSICFSNMSQGSSRQLECTHTFHTRCIERWKRTSRTCPICRQPFDLPMYNVSVTIQCVSDGQTATETYTTSNIQSVVDGLGLDTSLLSRSRRDITHIDFGIEFGEIVEEVLRELGISRFRIPGSNTVDTA